MGECADPVQPVKIVLADDHAVLRSGLSMLLAAESDFEVVAEAGTIQSVFSAVRTHRPAILVLDLNMPGGSSVDAIPRIRRISPGTSVIVLTMEHDAAFRRAALEAGAEGYVLKDEAPRVLVRAIRTAIRAAPAPLGGRHSPPGR